MEKRLTLIVPAYNMEAYLPICLASVELPSESMQFLEIIVVNDGSSDRTSEIAHAFADKYPESVRVIDKPNGNYGSCINAALPLARGLFVKLLDADDTFDTDVLLKFLEFLRPNGDSTPDLVLTDYVIVCGSGQVTQRVVLPFKPYENFSIDEFLSSSPVLMHGLTYRTEMLRVLHYRQLEGVSYTDQEWMLLPLAGVQCVRRFPQVLYRYLLGREGQTMNLKKVADSWWMCADIVLDLVKVLPQMISGSSPSVVQHLERRIAVLASDVYRGCLFGVFCQSLRARDFDLDGFDRCLATASPRLYAACAEVPYSRRIPYRFVRAWRRRVWWRGICSVFCRTYTLLVRLVCA